MTQTITIEQELSIAFEWAMPYRDALEQLVGHVEALGFAKASFRQGEPLDSLGRLLQDIEDNFGIALHPRNKQG